MCGDRQTSVWEGVLHRVKAVISMCSQRSWQYEQSEGTDPTGVKGQNDQPLGLHII